jgi:hypothetical protein
LAGGQQLAQTKITYPEWVNRCYLADQYVHTGHFYGQHILFQIRLMTFFSLALLINLCYYGIMNITKHVSL